MHLVPWLLIMAVLLSGCDKTASHSEQPLILLDMPSWQLILNDAAAPVETPLSLQLKFTESQQQVPIAIEGELVGISMYMGKIPLRFNQQSLGQPNSLSYQAEFLLGACSEPKMQWQINISIRYSGGLVEKHSQKFYSSW